MDICFEIDRERDVAYIPLNPHHPLKRVWKSLVREDWVLDIDAHGDLVGLELSRARSRLPLRWGVRLP